ncbi:MAG: hypothetical protein ACRDA4_06580 [Filifactoraceae bacterium]
MGFFDSLFSKNVEPHVWNKKEVDIAKLKSCMESGLFEPPFTDGILSKIAGKYKKYEKRGVSNLYLIKEVEDEGVVCAIYAFSTISESIDLELVEQIRAGASANLSVGEMRAQSYEQEPHEWWERDVEKVIERVNKNKAEGYIDLLIAELSKQGIIIIEREVRKRKDVVKLECSAVVYGIKESGMRKGVVSRIIQNEYL